MAILFSQADGSDQHYDTYEEFEQAFILMKRLNGEKVPQDLLDEAKAKYGAKDTEPFQVQIDGSKFESAIREATRELAEALDETAKDRTPESDDNVEETAEDEPRKVVALRNGLDVTEGRLYEEIGYSAPESNGFVYITDDAGVRQEMQLGTEVTYVEYVEEYSPTEFRTGDIVRVTEAFEDHFGDRVKRGAVYNYDESFGDAEPFVGTVLLGDNLDKLRLVCRREDRKDIEL